MKRSLTTVCTLLLLQCALLAQQQSLQGDGSSFVRDAYHRLAGGNVSGFDESRGLTDACKERIARLAGSEPGILLELAREIVLEEPRLLESEKRRGLKPPRLEVKAALMGAVVAVGGESAYALLEELARKVESGEAQRQALGASPADMLEVPVRFDRMLADVLEGRSENPQRDMKNAIRFAQEHFVAGVLLAQSIPGLSDEELAEMKRLALERIRAVVSRGKPEGPLAALLHAKVIDALCGALGLEKGDALPEDWYRRLSEPASDEGEEKSEVSGAPENLPGRKQEEDSAARTLKPLDFRKMNLPRAEERSAEGNGLSGERTEAPPAGGVIATYILLCIMVLGAVAVVCLFLVLRRQRQG